jgi:hypothetical protein
MAYWAVAQLQPSRERLALNMLARADFQGSVQTLSHI